MKRKGTSCAIYIYIYFYFYLIPYLHCSLLHFLNSILTICSGIDCTNISALTPSSSEHGLWSSNVVLDATSTSMLFSVINFVCGLCTGTVYIIILLFRS